MHTAYIASLYSELPLAEQERIDRLIIATHDELILSLPASTNGAVIEQFPL